MLDMDVPDNIFVSCRMESCGRKLEAHARPDSALLLVFRHENVCDTSLRAVPEKAVLIGFAML